MYSQKYHLFRLITSYLTYAEIFISVVQGLYSLFDGMTWQYFGDSYNLGWISTKKEIFKLSTALEQNILSYSLKPKVALCQNYL